MTLISVRHSAHDFIVKFSTFGFLQSSFLSFCDAFCPFNVNGAACVRVFDPLEILNPDLMVLLEPPGTKLLAYSIVCGTQIPFPIVAPPRALLGCVLFMVFCP